MASHQEVTLRRFVLVRTEDVSGTSGTGIVAEGVEWSNGQASLHWVTQLESVAVYASVKVIEQIHSHGGRTEIQWIDDKPKSSKVESKPINVSTTGMSICGICNSVGWYETGNNDLICDCPAGRKFMYRGWGQIVPKPGMT